MLIPMRHCHVAVLSGFWTARYYSMPVVCYSRQLRGIAQSLDRKDKRVGAVN